MKVGKIWGNTQNLLTTPLFEIHKIYIKPNSNCSLHIHQNKYNFFYVIKGKLFIEVHKNDYDLVDITSLNENEYTSVQPNEYHKFFTEDEEVIALEIYYPPGINPLDIVRKDHGSSKFNNEG